MTPTDRDDHASTGPHRDPAADGAADDTTVHAPDDGAPDDDADPPVRVPDHWASELFPDE